MNWTTDKPVFTEDCVLVTVNQDKKYWLYSVVQIYWNKKTGQWMWQNEFDRGNANDLKADKYLILPKH